MVQNSIPRSDPKPRAGRVALAGAAVVLASLAPGLAWGACPAAAQADVRVTGDPPTPRYRHQLTRPQIAALGGDGHMGPNSRAGLTHSQAGISVSPVVESLAQPDGTRCAAVRRVEVAWTMPLFLVDIAAEYKPGSCPYNEIVRHENEHVAIHQRAFLAAQQEIRQRVTEALRHAPTFVIRGTPQQAAQEAAARVMAAARPAVERYEAETRRQNAALDTPETYRAVSARCRDW